MHRVNPTLHFRQLDAVCHRRAVGARSVSWSLSRLSFASTGRSSSISQAGASGATAAAGTVWTEPGPSHPEPPEQPHGVHSNGLGASQIAALPAYEYDDKKAGGDECAVCLGELTIIWSFFGIFFLPFWCEAF